jgi:hypothetical protein
MKTLAFVFAAVMLLAATASAGELAVSKSTLNHMGLGGMQTMSDTDGSAVRGKGTSASVLGFSTAAWPPGAFSANGYTASSSKVGPVPSGASGNSLSFAGQVGVAFDADPTGFSLSVLAVGGVSGGGASAFAF